MDESAIATDTPPPPPPPRARRKPRQQPPPPLAAGGTPVLEPTAPAPVHLGAPLVEAARTAMEPVSLDATVGNLTPCAPSAPSADEAGGAPTQAPDVAAAVPPGRDMEVIADDFVAAGSQSCWKRTELVLEALDLEPDTAFAHLARLARARGDRASRSRISEMATVGRAFRSPSARVIGCTFDAHLLALKLASEGTPEGTSSARILESARVILMQTPDFKQLKLRLREVKGRDVVPPPTPSEVAPDEPNVAPDTASAFDAALAAVESIRAFLASAPVEQQYGQIVAAMKAILAKANAARKVTEYQPEEDLNADDALDADLDDDGDGDEEDCLDTDDGADDDCGDRDYEFCD